MDFRALSQYEVWFFYEDNNPSNKVFGFAVYDGVSTKCIYYNNVSKSNYYNFVYQYDGTKVSLYINGSLVEELQCGTPNIPSSSFNNIFGTDRAFSSARYFNGALDNIRIYDRTLTSNEINVLHNE